MENTRWPLLKNVSTNKLHVRIWAKRWERGPRAIGIPRGNKTTMQRYEKNHPSENRYFCCFATFLLSRDCRGRRWRLLRRHRVVARSYMCSVHTCFSLSHFSYDLASIDSTTCQKALLSCLFSCRPCHSSNWTCVLGGTRTIDHRVRRCRENYTSIRACAAVESHRHHISLYVQHNRRKLTPHHPNTMNSAQKCKRNRKHNNINRKSTQNWAKEKKRIGVPSSKLHTITHKMPIYTQTYSALHSASHQHTYL